MVNVGDILEFLDTNQHEYKFVGDSKLQLTGFSLPTNLQENHIIWVKAPEKFCSRDMNLSNILIVSNECFVLAEGQNVIVSNNSKAIFFAILEKFFSKNKRKFGIESSAIVKTDKIGGNIYIGHNSYIDEDVELGDNVIIKNNVVLEGKIIVGSGSIISSGTVIGTDGFGYYDHINGKNQKIEHFGGVIIGENVEIGANVCIDRGTLGDTVIGNNVKIDNLCHIAHNVVVGDDVNIIAHSMIGGSVVLGNSAYIAPSATLINQIRIEDNAMVGIGSLVLKDVKANVVVVGCPAKILKERK